MSSAPTPPAKLGASLLKQLVSLREQKGQIMIEDVGAILEGMASTLQHSDSAPDSFLRTEIEKMANYIIQAKSEILAMVPNSEEGAPKNISVASLELSEVVKDTEAATGKIMDAADEINSIISSIGDEYVRQKLGNVAIKIYDACTFQDITGQRINKVMRTLEQIESRVTNLVALFGGHLPEGYAPPKAVEKRTNRPDEALMSGPQLGAEAPSQDEIDKLFASM